MKGARLRRAAGPLRGAVEHQPAGGGGGGSHRGSIAEAIDRSGTSPDTRRTRDLMDAQDARVSTDC